MMKYTQEMNLVSETGYCMPFEEKSGDVRLLLGYGEQSHPRTGEPFFHHGVDFETNRYLLRSVADGTVAGMGSDPVYGLYQVIRHGDYEVTYGHLSNAIVPFGTRVSAGKVVAVSGTMLHMSVRYKGEELDPMPFLTMVYGNMMMFRRGTNGIPEIDTVELDIPTDYDDYGNEIEELMLRFFPQYLSDINSGLYRVPEHTEQSLRNIFTLSAIKNYFYERIPSFSNPMGIGERSIPIAAKVQNLLIGDFLNYLALQHNVFLSSASESDKKKE